MNHESESLYECIYIYLNLLQCVQFIWVCTAYIYIWHLFMYVIINFVDQVCFELDGYNL